MTYYIGIGYEDVVWNLLNYYGVNPISVEDVNEEQYFRNRHLKDFGSGIVRNFVRKGFGKLDALPIKVTITNEDFNLMRLADKKILDLYFLSFFEIVENVAPQKISSDKTYF